MVLHGSPTVLYLALPGLTGCTQGHQLAWAHCSWVTGRIFLSSEQMFFQLLITEAQSPVRHSVLTDFVGQKQELVIHLLHTSLIHCTQQETAPCSAWEEVCALPAEPATMATHIQEVQHIFVFL